MLWNISANSDVRFAWPKNEGGTTRFTGGRVVSTAAAARGTKSVGRRWAAGCGHCRRILASLRRRPTARTHASLEKSGTPRQRCSSRRAFARPGTAIVSRIGVRKAYAWGALVAVALNSASPLFANATLRARRANPIGEVCSAYARKPAGDYDGSGGLPNRKHKPSDCALCSLAADDLPVLPPYALLVSVSRPEADRSPLTRLIARRESCYRPAHPRAPPLAS